MNLWMCSIMSDYSISHLLDQIPYEDLTPEPIALPPRQEDRGYVRPPMEDQSFVPDRY